MFRRKYFVFIIVLVVVMKNGYSVAEYSRSDIDKIEKKCVQNRLAIKKYHVKLFQKTYEPGHAIPHKSVEFEFFLDGDNIRQDITRQISSGLIKDITAINSKENKRYSFAVGLENGLPTALQVSPYNNDLDKNKINSLFVDFRIIGFLRQAFI